MSTTPDTRAAPSGVLNPSPEQPPERPVPDVHWAAPVEGGWLEDRPLGPPAAPRAREGRTPGPAAKGRYGAHSARARRKTRFVYPVRRWPRRILITANVMVGLVLLSTVGALGYFDWRIGQIKRISLPHLETASRATAKGSPAAPGAAIPPMTILVVGSDSRAGDTGAAAAQFGDSQEVGGQRSDTIMLVHLVPATGSATILSIPRDLWVNIPGMGDSRINSAFNNGADLLIQTIETDLGIPINHYVEVNFESFQDIVNAVGGVEEYFPTPAKDDYSLLKIPAAGCYNMTGSMALAFVRARHYEYQVNGQWIYEAESDLARIQRQQSFVKKMIAKAESEGLDNPVELNGVIGGITTNLTLDSGFSQSLLLSLAERYRNISPGTLPTETVPTSAAVIGGADVLLLQQPQARQVIANFVNPPPPAPKSTTTTTTPAAAASVAPSSVRVAVLNGSGRTGEASAAGSALTQQGFVVTSVGSASAFTYTAPEILYGPGDLAKAQLLATGVSGSPQLQSDPSLQGADVELITGQSYQGITPVAVGGATPNTTPATTTTTTPYELPGTPPGFTPPAC